MFSLVNGVYQSYFASPQLNLLMVGGQGAGKTTFLERCKVTQFSTRQRPIAAATVPATVPAGVFSDEEAPSTTVEVVETPLARPLVVKAAAPPPGTSRKRSWLCPAPPKYANAVDDEEEEEDQQMTMDNLPEPPGPLESRRISQASMESIDLLGEVPQIRPSRPVRPTSPLLEHDLKPKAKMLPLDRIRPTIGMNLAKLDICGARCHVWDLGGRLQDLWERYYLDCDACVFVWAVDDDMDDDDDSSVDSDDRRPPLTAERQLPMLERVRASIPDDVPFLILGHYRHANNRYRANVLHSTSAVLPHYHNPSQAVFFANAADGEGVKAAMEWLIPLATRQQRVRTRPEPIVEK